MYTSTTEIYTYCHTLSLHDALPIFVGVVADLLVAGHASHHVHLAVVGVAAAGRAAVEAVEHLELRVVDAVGVVVDVRARDERLAAFPVQPLHLVRSEEHTSELQSLMRISYAVFCLKKKKNVRTSISLLNNK